MGKLKHITSLIYEAAAVKRLKRTGWQILGEGEEDVGEHSFMTAVIAYFLAKEISQARPLNMEKVLTIALFHDFHEARTGDIDKIAKLYVAVDKEKANREIFAGTDNELLKALDSYEKRETLEAKIVYEANIIALLVELKLLVEKGNLPAQEWLGANLKRLRLAEAIALARDLAQTNSQDWWKHIRESLHEEFAK